jgi:uncharacterized protein DUF6682
MGTFAGNTLIDELARRLRDTGNFGYPRATILSVLNVAQRSVNARLGLVMTTATVSTVNTSLFSVPAIATDIVRIVEIRDNDRVLSKVPYEQLAAQDADWFRLTGPQAEVFANIGRDLLAIIPIPVVPSNLTVTYVKQPTDLTDAGAPFWDLPDEHKSLVLDLVEAVLLFRGREFENMQAVLERIAPVLGLETTLQQLRRGGDRTRE